MSKSKSKPHDIQSNTTGPDCVQECEFTQSSLQSSSQHARRATSASAKAARSSARSPVAPVNEPHLPGTERGAEEQRSLHSESSADEAVSEIAVETVPETGRSVVLWIPPGAGSGDTAPISNTVLDFGPTLGDVIEQYHTDPLSGFHKLRFHVRRNSKNLHKRIYALYGNVPLSQINGRTLLEWHAQWSSGGKLAIGHSLIAQLRTISSFGFALLAEPECRRISEILGKLRFPHSPNREERMIAEQADAIRTWAHIIGWPSIAFAQAIQFELMLRQKDAIGEWLPISEAVESNIQYRNQIWHRGLRWSEVDDNLILRHVTSKKQKPIIADLKMAPMVMEELEFLDEIPSDDEPIIICETSGMPYTASEYRRKWRIIANYANVPHSVFNMDSRSGAISEAFDAGAAGERIQKTATHSDISMTQHYNRGDYLRASSEVQAKRIKQRHQATRHDDTRDAKWHRIDTSNVTRKSVKARKGTSA